MRLRKRKNLTNYSLGEGNSSGDSDEDQMSKERDNGKKSVEDNKSISPSTRKRRKRKESESPLFEPMEEEGEEEEEKEETQNRREKESEEEEEEDGESIISSGLQNNKKESQEKDSDAASFVSLDTVSKTKKNKSKSNKVTDLNEADKYLDNPNVIAFISKIEDALIVKGIVQKHNRPNIPQNTPKKRGRPRLNVNNSSSGKKKSKESETIVSHEESIHHQNSIISSSISQQESESPGTTSSISDISNEFAFMINIVAKRLTCPIPNCSRDWNHIEGLKYHSKSHIHNILDFLSWAYPSKPNEISPLPTSNGLSNNNDTSSAAASSSTIQVGSVLNSHDKAVIDSSILSLLSVIPINSFPLKITKFNTYVEGSNFPFPFPFLFGLPKEKLVPPPPPRKTTESTSTATRKIQSSIQSRSPGLNAMRDKNSLNYYKSFIKPCKESSVPKPNSIPEGVLIDRLNQKFSIFKQLSPSEIQDYLPTRRFVHLMNENLSRFKSKTIRKNGIEKEEKAFILNAGGNVWAMDWVPSVPSNENQYLAVGGYKRAGAEEHHLLGVKEAPNETTKNTWNNIQIWQLHQNLFNTERSNSDMPTPQLRICFLHQWGIVTDLKWCPYGHFEVLNQFEQRDNLPNTFPQIGLLAACFGDGKVRIISVPRPDWLERKIQPSDDGIIYVKIEGPILEFSLNDSHFWKCSWGGHYQLGAACSNGDVAIWDVLEAIKIYNANDKLESIDPISYYPVHKSAIRDICFFDPLKSSFSVTSPLSKESFESISSKRPLSLATIGYDGRIIVTDLRQPWIPIILFRMRAFMTSFTWSPQHNCIVFADLDNAVRLLLNGKENVKSTEAKPNIALVGFHESTVWSIDSSPFHPFTATCSADGSVKLVNVYRYPQRRSKPIQMTLYKIIWDKEKDEYSYQEMIPEEEVLLTSLKKVNMAVSNFPEEIALQKVIWNPNFSCSSWIASGGAAGLIRIESVYDT